MPGHSRKIAERLDDPGRRPTSALSDPGPVGLCRDRPAPARQIPARLVPAPARQIPARLIPAPVGSGLAGSSPAGLCRDCPIWVLSDGSWG